jgi:hypothetical protein
MRSQRRGSYRLPITLPVTLSFVYCDEVLRVNAQMVNLSSSGVLLAMDEKLFVSETVTLEFYTDDDVTIEGVVVRTGEAEAGRYGYRVAIAFINMTYEQEERFHHFIMDEQRIRRKLHQARWDRYE